MSASDDHETYKMLSLCLNDGINFNEVWNDPVDTGVTDRRDLYQYMIDHIGDFYWVENWMNENEETIDDEEDEEDLPEHESSLKDDEAPNGLSAFHIFIEPLD